MQSGLQHINDLFNTKVKINLFTAGSCIQLEKFTLRTGKLRKIRIPANFAHIEHPTKGGILFDTGYAKHFFTATKKFPFRLYRWITPVTCTHEDQAVTQLRVNGIRPESIRYIVISHFHADHIGGLRDFPNAKFIYLHEALTAVINKPSWLQVKAGFLPELLPEDFMERSIQIDETNEVALPASFPFKRGLDLFGDNSMIVVDLPGHAQGQIGLLCHTSTESYFLCADAAWSSEAIRKKIQPYWIVNALLHKRKQYTDSFQRVVAFRQKNPTFKIVPAHCPEMEKAIKEGEGTL